MASQLSRHEYNRKLRCTFKPKLQNKMNVIQMHADFINMVLKI